MVQLDVVIMEVSLLNKVVFHVYILKAEHSFDSAHFLAEYKGKCGNIHGHRWRKVEVEIQTEELVHGGQLDGMIIDFSD